MLQLQDIENRPDLTTSVYWSESGQACRAKETHLKTFKCITSLHIVLSMLNCFGANAS